VENNMTMINKEKAIEKINKLITQHTEVEFDCAVEKAIDIIKHMNPVMQSKVTNPDDYEELFDDMIHEVLRVMASAKGIELNSNSGLIADIRESIISHANNYHMNLEVPYKEYNVGDKVSLYYEGVPQQATIIKVANMDSYGLVLNDYRVVFFRNSDSPTNYIIELQKDINVE
jgi:hypothetical protein